MKNEKEYKWLAKRCEDDTNIWCDKQILQFFRNNFTPPMSRRFISIYFALCEIENDIEEHEIEIKNLVKTVSEYTGITEKTAQYYLKILEAAKFFSISDKKQEDLILTLYEWKENDVPIIYELINNLIKENKYRG